MCLLLPLLCLHRLRHRRLLLLLMFLLADPATTARRTSSLQFDKHTLCVVCRDVKCSLDTRCKECKSSSKEFMLGYVKHQHSLVLKGKKPATTSSPSVTAVTTAPIVSLPSLPVSEDHFRQLMHSMLQDMLQSGSIGINQPSTAPPAVPVLAPMITGATRVSVTPVEAPSTESPVVVLPTLQEDHSPHPTPHILCLCVSYVARSGVSNVGGSLSSSLGHTLSVSHGTDHLQVVNVAPSAVVSVASALSPGSLLFPFSDSGFTSFSAASSSRPLSLPPPLSSSSSSFRPLSLPPPLSSSSSSSRPLSLPPPLSSSSAFLLSSLPPPPLPLPLPPTHAFPPPFAPPPFSCRSSFLASASLPPPPPGFPPLPPSVSPPLPSSSLLPQLLRSLLLFLLSVLPLQQARLPLLSFRPPPLWTSLRIRLRFWVCLMIISVWRVGIFSLGGSDFCVYLSAFYPHLSSDASHDFASGSSVFSRPFVLLPLLCLFLQCLLLLLLLRRLPLLYPFLSLRLLFSPLLPCLSAFFSWFSFSSAGMGCVRVGVCVSGLFCSSSSVCSFFSVLTRHLLGLSGVSSICPISPHIFPTSTSVRCWWLSWFALTPCFWSLTSLVCCQTCRLLLRSGLSRLWLM